MLFIAEIGMNHNGNFDLAHELIKKAAIAGADIAKFQLGWRDGQGEINCLTLDDLKRIVDWCKYYDIEFMASIITEQAFEMIQKIPCDRYKVASRTLKDNFNLAQSIVSKGKETIVSLGMWEKEGMPFPENENVRYLWCKSLYPTYVDDLVGLPKDFTASVYDGYSDHTVGIEACLIAIARGAQIIEKHFTLDKSDTTIRDHVLSATPDEFRQLTTLGNDIAKKIHAGV